MNRVLRARVEKPVAEILAGTLPAAGHVLSLQPVVRELVARGHTVRWYTSDRYAAQVEKTGARLEPMSSDLDMFAGPLDELYPERAQLKALNRMTWDLKHRFMGPSAAQADELGLLHARVPADVLLCDPGFGAIRMLGQRTAVPWVSVGSAPLTLPSRDTAPFGSGLPPSSSALGRPVTRHCGSPSTPSSCGTWRRTATACAARQDSPRPGTTSWVPAKPQLMHHPTPQLPPPERQLLNDRQRERLAALDQYRERTGQVVVPRQHGEVLHGDPADVRTPGAVAEVSARLGVWVSNTKSRRRKLSGRQLALPAALGWEWAK